jgi:site-specific recombinase XerD
LVLVIRRQARAPARAGVVGREKGHLAGHSLRSNFATSAARGGVDLAFIVQQTEHKSAAGIATKLGNHSLRATGITAYLKNGGTLEKAAAMANHASTRTTRLYDRRRDELSLDEVERIVI